jgi:hypothetical protein
MAQPNISSLLKALQIPTKVHSVYLIGSRLWGTHSAKSDYDLLIVVADPASSTSPFQKSQHKGQYDATLLTETEFREQVNRGSLIETLCCLIPDSEECVFMNDAPNQRCGLIGKDHLQSIRIWVDERTKKDRDKASKFWAKGGEMREKGWKILQHTIAAESIFQGLKRIIDEDKIDLRDVSLTQETLRQFVATGRQEQDRAWLGLSWDDVLAAYEQRIDSVRTIV